jgi:sugar O-acyltransferase (sialic acid O-acetyltransferase NeuD family)
MAGRPGCQHSKQRADMKSLILIGGGGHCRSAIDVITSEGSYQIAGITDRVEKVGESINGYKIIAEDSSLKPLIEQYRNCLVTIGQLKSSALKVKLFKMAENLGAEFPVIVSPTAYASSNSDIDRGSVVFHQAVINTHARVGINSVINSGAIIEHDAVIGDHTHIAPGAIVNGHCRVGNHCLIGSGTVMIQETEIGDHIIVGANSTVNRSLTEPGIYAGSPARKVPKR